MEDLEKTEQHTPASSAESESREKEMGMGPEPNESPERQKEEHEEINRTDTMSEDTPPDSPITARGGEEAIQSNGVLDGTMEGLSRVPTQKSETGSLPGLRKKQTRLANKEAHPMQHLGITLGLPMILLFDVVVPCIIYYTWYNAQVSKYHSKCSPFLSRGQNCPIASPEFDKDILGYAIISFGFGELWILIARVWRLFRHRDQCAPLLSRNKYELDATSWVYGVAMIMALIPFVIGSSLVIPTLYLYSPAFIMGFLGILMLVTTTYPFTLPVGINSQARGSRLRPFIYYAAEDFIAVDGLQDREFRVRYNERYESSRPFRRMFVYLTLWWMLGVGVYIGCLSAVIFNLEFHYAFGLSLGVLFSYIALWAGGSYAYVVWEMARQEKMYEDGKSNV